MRPRWLVRISLLLPMLLLNSAAFAADASAKSYKEDQPRFQTSDRCVACHNGLSTSTGEDVSPGIDWRTSLMANSSRDPYWQAVHSSSIAERAAEWSSASRRTLACQYGSREELAIRLVRQSIPGDTSSPVDVLSPL